MANLHPFVTALLGGFCIGIAAVMLMVLVGRIAGITGMVFSGIRSPLQNIWSVMFLIGLALGAFLYDGRTGIPHPAYDVPLPMILGGAFLVGFGTKLGSGCTSGHGICGLGRLSPRSLIATCTFMLFTFITVFVRFHSGLV